MQTGINHHGKRQAAMKITSKLNTINAPVNIDTSLFKKWPNLLLLFRHLFVELKQTFKASFFSFFS